MPRRLLPLLAIALTACQPSPGSARPRAASPQPDAPPQRVVPLFRVFDANSNGLADTLLVFAYLFPGGSAAPVPVWAEGQFEFTLISAEGGEIAEWKFPNDQVLRHRDSDTFGRTHSFTLDIRAAAGTDQLPPQSASVATRFVRADGITISAAERFSVRIGMPEP